MPQIRFFKGSFLLFPLFFISFVSAQGKAETLDLQGTRTDIIREFYQKRIEPRRGKWNGFFEYCEQSVRDCRILSNAFEKAALFQRVNISQALELDYKQAAKVLRLIEMDALEDGKDITLGGTKFTIENQLRWLEFWSRNILIWSHLLAVQVEDAVTEKQLEKVIYHPVYMHMTSDLAFFAIQFGFLSTVLGVSQAHQKILLYSLLGRLTSHPSHRGVTVKTLSIFTDSFWHTLGTRRDELLQSYDSALKQALTEFIRDPQLLERFKRQALGPWSVFKLTGSMTLSSRLAATLATQIAPELAKEGVKKAAVSSFATTVQFLSGPGGWALGALIWVATNVGEQAAKDIIRRTSSKRELCRAEWQGVRFWASDGIPHLLELQENLCASIGRPYEKKKRLLETEIEHPVCQIILGK